MRRLFVALLTALTVVIGLSALVGTASAATPVPAVDVSLCISLNADLTTAKALPQVTDAEKAARTAAINLAERKLRQANCGGNGGGSGADCPGDRYPDVPGCQRDGGVGYPGNGSWNDRLDGRYFRLDNGPALDVCDSGASTYDLWLNRNGSYRDRIVRQLNAQRWNDLRRADCGVIVSNNGDCITYVTARDSIRNWNNDYNRLRGVYNGDFNRLNTTDRDNLRRLWDNASRYRGQWDSSLSRLRTVCQDNTPTVTIIQAPPVVLQAPAAAPAPVYSTPAPSGVSAGSIPQGSVNTGGWSAAFVLAHNRAI